MKVQTLAMVALLAGATTPEAAIPLTDLQLDSVTAGNLELGQFQTTILNIADSNYLDTFNVMQPYFAPGTPVIYFGPLTGPLFKSNVQVLPGGTGASVTFSH